MRKRDLIIEFLQLMFRKGKKAAPRFELGIKDLQSSALPLGHAANRKLTSLSLDRISDLDKKVVLVLSNGHGEDVIALRVIQALHHLQPALHVEVLPLVGEGQVFDEAVEEGWLVKIGPLLSLPSGGFSNQSLRGLIADISVGLFSLISHQWWYIRKLARQGRFIFAVGDLLPLFFAWSSGAEFVFLGTPKSDYTWRSGPGWAISDFYHRLKGSEWDPWEYALMRSSRCRLIAVRDQLTARGLRKHSVNALAPGNPMMDGFQQSECPRSLKKYRRIIVLCGSRVPEAEFHLKKFLEAIELLKSERSLAYLVALSSSFSLTVIEEYLKLFKYKQVPLDDDLVKAQSCWVKGVKTIFVGKDKFPMWAQWAELALSNAGTATEQLVGFGVPVLSLPGKGPQFKRRFALRQSRLLGGSAIPCKSTKELVALMTLMLKDHAFRMSMGTFATNRMGVSGGSKALAELIINCLLTHDGR